MNRPNPSFHYRQSRDRYLKKLRKQLARLPKSDGLEAFWVIDRGRMDSDFKKPNGYDYPDEHLFAKIDQPSAIHGWEVETLITELLACSPSDGPRVLNAKSWAAISEQVNVLRAIGNAESALIDSGLIFRTMFRLLHRQLPWQIHTWNAADAVRWWSIFQSDLLHSIFQERVGLSLRSFIRMGMAWNQILNTRPFSKFPTAEAALDITPENIEAFVRATCISLDDASTAAQHTISTASEIEYRRSALREKPIISIKEGTNVRYIRPIEQLLVWRITSGIYYDVIGDSRAANEIGIQYEKYTRRLLGAAVTNAKVDGDVEYGTKQNPRRSPDCFLHVDGDIQMLIECKAKKIPLVMQNAMGETKEREIAIGEIAKGIVQLCQFDHELSLGDVPGFRVSERPILLLAALDDWIFTGPDIKDEVFVRASEFAKADGLQSERIERKEVVLCTATELDQLVSTYSFDNVRRICTRSLEEKYKGYALIGIARECFKDERHPANYPLKPELDELIGL